MNKEEMRFKAAKGLLEQVYPIARGDLPFDEIAEECVGMADALLSALYPSTKEPSPVPDADGWIEHRPGDAMPCDGSLSIDVKMGNGVEYCDSRARFWAEGGNCWEKDSQLMNEIIAWRPAK